LTDQKAYKKIIEKIDIQLSKHQIKIVKGQAKIDARLVNI